jgi:N-acetylmuramoyl-L-alanine amidase
MRGRTHKTYIRYIKSALGFAALAVLIISLAACSGASTPLVTVSSAAAPETPAPTFTPSPTPVKTTQPDAALTPGADTSAEPSDTPKPSESQKPTDKPTDKPADKPADKPSGKGEKPLSGVKIGLDPGHQSKANSEKEPVSPGGGEMKKKVSSGTQGRFTRVPEYKVVLSVGLKLKEKLEALGATVVMTRETHDVNISNAERAQMMNDNGVDCWLRIHANGNDNPAVYGMFMLVPKEGCLDTSDAAVQEASVKLAKALLKAAVSSAGAKDLGLQPRGDQTGFNWSKVPVCNIEMGYMTNENEDNLLVSDEYQEKIAQGLAQGFVDYFSN